MNPLISRHIKRALLETSVVVPRVFTVIGITFPTFEFMVSYISVAISFVEINFVEVLFRKTPISLPPLIPN